MPPGAGVRDGAGGPGAVFCCPGCRDVHALLRSEGLDAFYARRRGWTAGTPDFVRPEPGACGECVRVEEGAHAADLSLSGIRCAACVWLVERHLARKPGVLSARVNFATHRATVRFDPAAATVDDVARWIAELGYVPRPAGAAAREEALRRERRDLLLRFGTAAFLASQVMMYTAGLYAGSAQGIDAAHRALFGLVALALSTPVVFYAGLPVLRGAAASLRRGAPGMDLLVALGVLAAWLYSAAMVAAGGEVYFDSCTMIVALVLLGRYLESVWRGRAAESLAGLLRLLPPMARRLPNGGGEDPGDAVSVPVEALRPGDRVAVIPGERIPADGRVAGGLSEADESLLSGESRPVAKEAGSRVYAGTLNLTGRLTVEVAGTGRDTALARIVRAVEEALGRKAPAEEAAGRIVRFFVPAVVAVAAATFLVLLRGGTPAGPALLRGVSVLVVACPCALGLAVPLAVYAAAAAARDGGILVKGGDVLERAARVRTVLLDKTGTLTEGRPRLAGAAGFREEAAEVLRLAAALEAHSEHPVAAAVRAAAPGPLPPVEAFRAVPGEGVEGRVGGRRVRVGRPAFALPPGAPPEPAWADAVRAMEEDGKTVVWVADEGGALGVVAVADALRPEAREAVAALERAGCAVTLVTGDGEGVSSRIAREAGVRRVLARLSPAGKAEAVRRARGAGGYVLAAGDGINDAPALAEADVGVAMGRGTDAAIGAADAVLVAGDLGLLPRFLDLARRTARVIRQNLAWAFSYNLVAIPLAAAGLLTPVASAALMAGSSLAVTANAMRLGRRGPR